MLLINISRSPDWHFIINRKPISCNHQYGQHGRIRFLMKEGRLYKEFVQFITRPYFKSPDDSSLFCLEVTYYFPDKRRRDVTDYDKALLDSMTGVVYKDDCQIQRILLKKYIDKDNPRTEVNIWRLKNEE